MASLLLATAALVFSLTRQRYKEDITDFLPLGSKYGQALKVYQEISGASRIVAIVSHADTCRQRSPDALCSAVDAFAALVAERDTTGIADGMMTQVDMEQMEQTVRFLYANMPYFLTEGDYARMDSLLALPGFIPSQLSADKQALLFPMTGMMAQNVERDPLNLFTPVAAMLQQRQPTVNYENYDGYIFTPDMSRAIVLMQSPYGSSETSRNARLLRFLDDCRKSMPAAEDGYSCCPADIHFTGGPVIAVGNAEQIKHDSILAVSLAVLLIVGLLFAVFRRVRGLLLIVLSIAWGWLFAMGALALLRDSVSIIVIGISSVIVGIAVNYPLHLIVHLRHTPSVRQALREIAVPLIVGNITTVGAFLALVPLESVALRDLGLFSSLLLVGTILFVLVFLPQFGSPTNGSPTNNPSSGSPTPGPSSGSPTPGPSSGSPTPGPSRGGEGSGYICPLSVIGKLFRRPVMGKLFRRSVIGKLFRRSVIGKLFRKKVYTPLPPEGGAVGRYSVGRAILLLTLVFGYFSLGTTFDANIANINYMTPQQRQDMALLSVLSPHSSVPGFSSDSVGGGRGSAHTVYVVSADTSFDAALCRSAALLPQLEQLKRAGGAVSVGSCHPFLCSHEEQQRRLALWHGFTSRHAREIEDGIRAAARAEGFADGTFDAFLALLHTDLQPQPLEYFAPLTSTVFANSLATVPDASPSGTTFNVITTLTADTVFDVFDIENAQGTSYAFDVQGMNSAIATRLSDDFNYIGWACGLIVFLFLWFSLGSFELALLSFLPMAVSWVWILGLMSVLGIQFNVVNIILATFIFGQGDDYTIFMTEGCQYEYAYRRPMLASYKQSIILSAAIMFIGIGALIFARHPALRSLAEVTIVGMSSVVLMAWLLPPLLFRWLVADGGGYRRRPLSLSLLWHRLRGERPGSDAYLRHLVFDRYRYKGFDVTTTVARNLRKNAVSRQPSATHPDDGTPLVIDSSGWGETALLTALQQPLRTIVAIEPDPEKLLVARHAAEGIAPNLIFMEQWPDPEMQAGGISNHNYSL